MGFFKVISAGVRTLLSRDGSDRELKEEVQHYMAEAEADLVATGSTPEEARRAVRLQYGDGLPTREDVRAFGWENATEAFYADVKLAARRLRRSPGSTAVVVLTLGLGIGSATAIFSVVSPVLLEPLAYPDAERIVAIADRSEDGSLVQPAFGTYRELQDRARVFEGLSVFKSWQPSMTGGSEPERLEAQRVSAAYFDVLGVAPVMGRGFDAVDDRPGGPNPVILSDGLWSRRFGSDPTIVGQLVYLDSEPYTVVGVMPPTFINVPAPGARAWALLQYDPVAADFDSREWGHHLDMIGRVRRGVELEEAQRALAAISSQRVSEFPRPSWADMGEGFEVRRLRDASNAGARPTMLVLLGSVALLLIIASVNVTILFLARGARRQGEFAVRVALGAGRGHMVRQLLTESLMLAVLGGVLGTFIARLGIAALVAASPPALSRIDAIGLDGKVLGFALALTTLVGLIVGLAPAMARTSRSMEAVRSSGRGSIGRFGSPRRALVITEVALAMILLIGAGLMLRSTQRLFEVPVGFESEQVLVMQVYATGLERGDAATHGFFQRALEAVRGVPGVRSAAMTSQLPLSGQQEGYGVALADREQAGGVNGSAWRYAVAPGYFETMGMRLLAGRSLMAGDLTGGIPVAVVSETMAAELFQNGNPIGRRIHVGPTELEPYTIVGVVGDVKQESLETQQLNGVYTVAEQWHWADRVRWIVVRTDQEPLALADAIRQAVWSVDGNQPIVRTQLMRDLVMQSEAQRRFVLMVLIAFSVLALALAGIGLYGVLAGNVAERMQEIGVRSALGATRESLLALIVRQGMGWTGAGIAIGILGAAAASRVLGSFLFGVSNLDPMTYLAVAAVLGVVSAVACWIPAVKAANVNPLKTLNSE